MIMTEEGKGRRRGREEEEREKLRKGEERDATD